MSSTFLFCKFEVIEVLEKNISNHGYWTGPNEQCWPSAIFNWPTVHAAHDRAHRSLVSCTRRSAGHHAVEIALAATIAPGHSPLTCTYHLYPPLLVGSHRSQVPLLLLHSPPRSASRCMRRDPGLLLLTLLHSRSWHRSVSGNRSCCPAHRLQPRRAGCHLQRGRACYDTPCL
jgi:hypothetical protein